MEDLLNVVKRLEIVAKKFEGGIDSSAALTGGPAANANQSASTNDKPKTIIIYEESVYNAPLAGFLTLCKAIGGDVAKMGDLVDEAFQAHKQVVWRAAGMKKPSAADQLQSIIAPISQSMEKVQQLATQSRNSPMFNHLSAVSEAIPALGWIVIEPTPAPHIKEMTDASQFYTNRVLKEYKDKDQKHVDWVKAWLETLNQMREYVRVNHTTGMVWNSSPGSNPGGPVASATGSGMSQPPPPPPPPPADYLQMGNSAGSASSRGGGDRSALFSEINKGDDITKGLKKVSDDMKTHKNPSLRASGLVPDKSSSKPAIAPKPGQLGSGSAGSKEVKQSPDKPERCELEGGKKWIVEYYKGTRDKEKHVTINITDLKETVYIYKCEYTVVQIKGKVNSLTMDNCKKASCVFDALLSCADVINCQSVKIQTLGTMPTLQIQKTDGCQVFLSRSSLNAEIVTSKSSEMNISIPDAQEEFNSGTAIDLNVQSEHPVPEQFKTVWNGKKLETTVVDIS